MLKKREIKLPGCMMTRRGAGRGNTGERAPCRKESGRREERGQDCGRAAAVTRASGSHTLPGDVAVTNYHIVVPRCSPGCVIVAGRCCGWEHCRLYCVIEFHEIHVRAFRRLRTK